MPISYLYYNSVKLLSCKKNNMKMVEIRYLRKLCKIVGIIKKYVTI